MVTADTFIPMAIIIQVIGLMVKEQAGVNLLIKAAKSMKECGNTANLLGTEEASEI